MARAASSARSVVLVPAVALLAFLGGCRDEGRHDPGALRRASTDAYACSLAPVATSPADLGLGYVRSVDVDSRGRIYVADWPEPRIVVLSPEGGVVRSFGKKGKGPTEFGFISNVDVFSGDSLLVLDQELARISVFAPDSAAPAYTLNAGVSVLLTHPAWARKTASGMILAGYRRAFAATDPAAQDNRHREVVRLLRPDGGVAHDSLVVSPAEESLVSRRGGVVSVGGPSPFGRRPVIALGGDDRLYVGWTDSLSVAVLSLDGRRVGGFSLPHEAVPVTRGDVEAVLASRSPQWAATYRRALEESAPETWPAFRDFLVDGERVWMALSVRPGEATRWAAFDATGARLCSVVAPAAVELKVIRNGKAYGVLTDEMDVPRIVVYRIEEPRRPVESV